MNSQVFAVQLSVVAKSAASHIDIHYEMANTTSSRILVFDHHLYFGPKSVVQLDETGVNIGLDSDGGVRLVRGIFSPPIYMSVFARPPVLVTPVEPGGVAKGTIQVAVPSVESNIFFPKVPCDAAKAVVPKRVRLQIGWVEMRPEMTFREYVIDGKKFANIGSNWGQPVQRVAEASVSANLKVCPYPGRFDSAVLTQ